MASFNISEVIKKKSLEAPLKSFLWRVVLPRMTTNEIVRFDELGDSFPVDIEEYPNINYEISHRVVNVTTPFFNIDTEKAIDGNSFWYYAKHNDIGTIAFDIYEYEDMMTYQYLDAWKSMMINSNGTYNPPAAYKKDFEMYRLSASKEDLIIFKFKNYFINSVADLASDYETTDTVKYSVSLTGDSMEYEVKPIASLGEKPEDINIIRKIFDYEKRFGDVDESVINILIREGKSVLGEELDTTLIF